MDIVIPSAASSRAALPAGLGFWHYHATEAAEPKVGQAVPRRFHRQSAEPENGAVFPGIFATIRRSHPGRGPVSNRLPWSAIHVDGPDERWSLRSGCRHGGGVPAGIPGSHCPVFSRPTFDQSSRRVAIINAASITNSSSEPNRRA
jgi:hypothetical protein